MLKPLPTFIPQKLTVIDRLIIKLGNGHQDSLCILQEQLPLIFRITAIQTSALPDGTYEVSATIFHEKAQLDVLWTTSLLNNRLDIGQLVSIRWKGKLAEQSGKIVISRLAVVETPSSYVNLLDTIPVAWRQDRKTLQRARKLIELLYAEYKKILNTIFWNSKILYELVSSPSFISTIERCERVMKCEYKFFINIDQTVLMLLVNASSKQSVSEVIIEQIVEANITEKHGVKSECWTMLLMSLDY